MTLARVAGVGQRALAADAVSRATARLIDLQDVGGCWPAERSAVTPDAEDLLYREFTGNRTADLTEATARWIRSRQLPDGSWAARAHGGGDVSASVLAYLALRLAGDSPDAYHLALAAGWIRDAGGPAAAGLRARIWLAAFGHTDWPDIPFPPLEAFRRSASSPLRAPGLPGWDLHSVAPLAVLSALRPVRRLPFGIGELRPSHDRPGSRGAASRDQLWRQATQAVAARRCGGWLVARQRADGSWPGSRGGWLLSLLALEALGYRRGDPVLARGRAALDAAVLWTVGPAGPVRQVADTSPPVRQTALALAALAAAGLPGDHPARTTAAAWLAGQDVSTMGVEVAASFLLAGPQPAIADPVVRRVSSLQRSDGGWSGTFAARPGVPDLGDLRAGSSVVPTAGAVHGLALAGPPGSRAIRRGVSWLLRVQLPDGSWPADRGVADLPATSAVLPALLAAGVLAGKPAVRSAVRWLVERQNDDGGWGGGRPGRDFQPARPRMSAPVPTAQALAALAAVGGQDLAEPVRCAAAFLARSQQDSGAWLAETGQGGGLEHLTAPLAALGDYLFGGRQE